MPDPKSNPVILGTARTPFGRFGGALASFSAVELGGFAMAEAMSRADIDKGEVTHTFMGCVVQAGLGQVPSRQAAFKAGLGREVTSDTINRVCASGMRAIDLSNEIIPAGPPPVDRGGRHGKHDQHPLLLFGARWGLRMGNGELVDGVQP